MEVRTLKYYLAVAREQNITKAAELLHLTQPTLSRQMMQLEEELDTQLFIRGKRKIELTDAGMLLKRRAEEIVSLIERTEREFLSEASINGQISIGSGEFSSSNHFTELLKQFQEMYPKVTFDLFSGNTDEIQYKLDNGLIDLAIVMKEADINKYDFIRFPEQDIWGVLLRKDDPLAKLDYIEAKDLVNHSLAISRRNSIQNEIKNWAGDFYSKYHFVAQFDMMMVNIVKNDIAKAITIHLPMIKPSYEQIVFRPFKPELTTNSILMWKKNQPLTPTLLKFIEFLKAEYQNKGKK